MTTRRPSRHVESIASEIDARIGDGAQHESRNEARDPALGRQCERERQRHAETDHGPPQVGPRLAIAGEQAPDEGWRAVRTGDERLGQGEEQRAAEGSREWPGQTATETRRPVPPAGDARTTTMAMKTPP